MTPGQYYLFVCPFFMTFVGRYKRHVSFQEIEIDHAMYFSYTGKTFDKLCWTGLATETKCHPCGDGVLIPAQGPKIPWRAKTPWANPSEQ